MKAMRKVRWIAAAAAALALAGCGGGAETKAGPGEVAIQVTSDGFVPAVAQLEKGKPATLVVTRKTDKTCATEMVFAANGEKHVLPLNQTVRIELPADRPDTMSYACAMDMIKGQVVSR